MQRKTVVWQWCMELSVSIWYSLNNHQCPEVSNSVWDHICLKASELKGLSQAAVVQRLEEWARNQVGPRDRQEDMWLGLVKEQRFPLPHYQKLKFPWARQKNKQQLLPGVCLHV